MMSHISKRTTSGCNNRDSISNNIHRIDLTVVSDIESDLDVNEIISLVFLLYDETHIAIERLKLLILTAANSNISCISLLHDWVVKAHCNKNWRFELLEALAICQLYQFIRKLGFDVQQVKKHYLPDNLYLFNYIHPVRKILYKLCERLLVLEYRSIYTKFASIVGELDIQKEPCELLLMKLISKEHIVIGQWSKIKENERKAGKFKKCDLKPLCDALYLIQRHDLIKLLTYSETFINKESGPPDLVKFQTSTPELVDSEDDESDDRGNLLNFLQEIEPILEKEDDILERLTKVKVDLATDASDKYKIKNSENAGFCIIINQRNFFSEAGSDDIDDLEERLGTEKDEHRLRITWRMLGFKVIVCDDLRSNQIIPVIRKAINKKFENDHSVFVLCILSHGRKGIIYGSNTKPVSIDNIEQTLRESPVLAGIPKIMFIQACQGTDSMQAFSMITTDGPQSRSTLKPNLPALKDADFLVIQSTTPDHVSYRLKDHGTWFVQTFCDTILKHCNSVYFPDIMLKITQAVTNYRYKNQGQVPQLKSTFTKKLCLHKVNV